VHVIIVQEYTKIVVSQPAYMYPSKRIQNKTSTDQKNRIMVNLKKEPG